MERDHHRKSRTEFHYNQPLPMSRLILAALVSLLFASVAAGADRPNIVFIMTDDHAAHAIGAYGSRVNQTPNLDRLAREGMLFQNVFATNSDLHAEPRRDPHRAVLAPQRRDRLQSLRQQPHDRRPAAAEGRLLHGDDRQVAPRQRSGRLRPLGDPARPGRLRQSGALHRHGRDDLHRPVRHRRHHRPRDRLHREAAAQPAVLPDGAPQGAAPAMGAGRHARRAVCEPPHPRARHALGFLRDAHRCPSREPAARARRI